MIYRYLAPASSPVVSLMWKLLTLFEFNMREPLESAFVCFYHCCVGGCQSGGKGGTSWALTLFHIRDIIETYSCNDLIAETDPRAQLAAWKATHPVMLCFSAKRIEGTEIDGNLIRKSKPPPITSHFEDMNQIKLRSNPNRKYLFCIYPLSWNGWMEVKTRGIWVGEPDPMIAVFIVIFVFKPIPPLKFDFRNLGRKENH